MITRNLKSNWLELDYIICPVGIGEVKVTRIAGETLVVVLVTDIELEL